jgi:hypothetical protein
MRLSASNSLQTLINFMFASLLLIIICLLVRIIQSKKIKIFPAFINKKSRLISFLIKRKTQILIIFSIFAILILGIGGTTLTFSLKTKSEGDIDYNNMDYIQALTRYERAKDLWFPEKISLKLRDRDLYSKINKTKIMIQSSDNYQKGKEAFDNKQYSIAREYFNLMAENDPRDSEAKDILQKIQKIETIKPTPTQTISKGANESLSQTLKPAFSQESYSYDSYYPIILSFSDNKGSLIKRSSYNGYYGLQSSNQTSITLKSGDTIEWKVQASDPKGRQLLYNFNSNSTRFNDQIGLEGGGFKWRTDNKIQYTISSDDIKSSGELLRIVAQIKSDKENLRFPGGEYDDTTYLDYKLNP